MWSMDEYENVIFHAGGFCHFKNLQLRFKTSAELQGGAIPICVVYLAFYLVEGVLHENIATFSALDVKIILSFQCIFACLFNGWFIF